MAARAPRKNTVGTPRGRETKAQRHPSREGSRLVRGVRGGLGLTHRIYFKRRSKLVFAFS